MSRSQSRGLLYGLLQTAPFPTHQPRKERIPFNVASSPGRPMSPIPDSVPQQSQILAVGQPSSQVKPPSVQRHIRQISSSTGTSPGGGPDCPAVAISALSA
ncbi:hypothetical protein ABZ714_21710 [Streptomyces sp. NPDC006798]|uniref:hypothetical protein n=1 Tax=Streptomyces sp. NPDC006798 TaxID=3155462 RepID=UPI0033CD3487